MSQKTVKPAWAASDQSATLATVEREAAGQSPKSSPILRGFSHRRTVRNAAAVVPALAAALTSFAFGGFDVFAASRALVLGLAILATAMLLKQFRYPHRLLPVSRLAVALGPALVGGFVAGVLAISDTFTLAATGLVPATLVAMVAALVVEFSGSRYLTERPLRVAVLGSPVFAAGLEREIAAGSADRFEVVGWLNVGDSALEDGSMQIGTLDSIRAAITEHEIDLLVRGPGLWEGDISRQAYQAIAEGCVGLPVRMIDGNQFYEQQFGHVPLGTIDSEWFLYLMHPNFEGTSPRTKRLFDLFGAGIAGLVALPVLVLAAIAIKLEDRGSIFYRQIRAGEGGSEYEILKLRTMSEDAEAGGAQWSVAGDQRVTRVGRVLRRTHIDELPQILNVLRGEMTLVGPRPERPEIIASLETMFPHYKQRLLVKPGVTGWAQVRCGYAGSDLGSAWKLCHDLFYLKHRSMLADALIILETLAIAAKDAHRPMRSPQAQFLWRAAARGHLLGRRNPPPAALGPEGIGGVPEISVPANISLAPGAAR